MQGWPGQRPWQLQGPLILVSLLISSTIQVRNDGSIPGGMRVRVMIVVPQIPFHPQWERDCFRVCEADRAVEGNLCHFGTLSLSYEHERFFRIFRAQPFNPGTCSYVKREKDLSCENVPCIVLTSLFLARFPCDASNRSRKFLDHCRFFSIRRSWLPSLWADLNECSPYLSTPPSRSSGQWATRALEPSRSPCSVSESSVPAPNLCRAFARSASALRATNEAMKSDAQALCQSAEWASWLTSPYTDRHADERRCPVTLGERGKSFNSPETTDFRG